MPRFDDYFSSTDVPSLLLVFRMLDMYYELLNYRRARLPAHCHALLITAQKVLESSRMASGEHSMYKY